MFEKNNLYIGIIIIFGIYNFNIKIFASDISRNVAPPAKIGAWADVDDSDKDAEYNRGFLNFTKQLSQKKDRYTFEQTEKNEREAMEAAELEARLNLALKNIYEKQDSDDLPEYGEFYDIADVEDEEVFGQPRENRFAKEVGLEIDEKQRSEARGRVSIFN